MSARQKPPPIEGKCHLCGLVTRLTYEHVPPKKAFNDSSLLRIELADWLRAEDETRVRSSKDRRGAGSYTLCERCNNVTGALYGEAYISWAHQAMRFALMGGSSLALPYLIFPGRIAKQIICMFVSANGDDFTDRNPQLRKFVLDRDARGISDDFRLYCYLINPRVSKRSRQTGIVGRLQGPSHNPFAKGHTFSEISFPPLGYILTMGDDLSPPENGLADITPFTHHAWKDYREVHLRLPTLEVHTYFPADFRAKTEWERAKASKGGAEAE